MLRVLIALAFFLMPVALDAQPVATVAKPAQPEIADLWQESFDQGLEMLACLDVRNDTIQGLSDRHWTGGPHAIGGKGVAEEIEGFCSPPEWNGLIHTHPNDFITLSGKEMNQRWPYLTGTDMNAAASWVARHGEPGLFCVISDPGAAGIKCVRVSRREVSDDG